jgi:peptidoglycan/xylan/chitin deacetylase (PgdA/CDA1 family)
MGKTACRPARAEHPTSGAIPTSRALAKSEERMAKSETRPSSYNQSVLTEVLGAAGFAGLATWAGFQSMWPTSQVYGRTFLGLPTGSHQMALTYDDGPNDPYTERLLELLDRHQVKATFFLIGRFVKQRPDLARALVAAGHAIGNHTWDHPNLIFCSVAELRRQLRQTQQAIFDATGVGAKLFRPPFGGRRPDTLSVARSLGLQPVMWNVTCRDWKAKSADEIVGYAERQIRGGDVILLHDGEFHRIGVDRSRSVAATSSILLRYKGEGYEFSTIPQMMEQQLALATSH